MKIPKRVTFYCPHKIINSNEAKQVKTRAANLGLEYIWIPCEDIRLMPKYEEDGQLVARGWKYGFIEINCFFDEILSERIETLFCL